MKFLILFCLLAGYQLCFAQTLSFQQMSQLIQAKETGIQPQLSSRGYMLSSPVLVMEGNKLYPVTSWTFSPAGGSVLSQLLLWQDSANTCYKLRFETSSPYIFSQVLNEMNTAGFSLSATNAGSSFVQLEFENKRSRLKAVLLQQPGVKKYQLDIQPYSLSGNDKIVRL